jgi:hypothetical protein
LVGCVEALRDDWSTVPERLCCFTRLDTGYSSKPARPGAEVMQRPTSHLCQQYTRVGGDAPGVSALDHCVSASLGQAHLLADCVKLRLQLSAPGQVLRGHVVLTCAACGISETPSDGIKIAGDASQRMQDTGVLRVPSIVLAPRYTRSKCLEHGDVDLLLQGAAYQAGT